MGSLFHLSNIWDSVILSVAQIFSACFLRFFSSGALRHTTCVLCSCRQCNVATPFRFPCSGRGFVCPVLRNTGRADSPSVLRSFPVRALPRYRLHCRPPNVRFARSLRARVLRLPFCKDASLSLLRRSVLCTSRGSTGVSRVSPSKREGKRLPSVNGRSLRHVLVRQISAPA